MKLSVIIVNYNVKHFLEQCIHSVEKAIHNIDADVYVVDNNSVDGSCAMVKEKFPWVKLIENKKNTGFSVANNQAMRESTSEYMLLLNPDTIVEEDTFEKVVQFMDEHPDAGGLGVKMIDGKGIFLPESKRGLPTPMVALYKITGLSKIFPKSEKFNKYYLGHLSNDETNEVEILAGAFMLMRKETLDKVGLLDEDYFMYGEDIDLSYRIIKGGYKNYYFADTTIIHYKGESTKKGSINYVKVFYNAMIIFAKKHFSEKNAKLFSFFINLGIYFRAFLAIISRSVKKTMLPVLDAIVLFAGFWFIAPLWEKTKYPEGGNFPIEYFSYAVPIYILIWMISIWLSGGYEKPIRILKLTKGMLIGTGVLLIFYSLLPEDLRYSRAMLIFGTVWGLIGMNLVRLTFHFTGSSNYKYHMGKKNRIAIVGKTEEANRISEILEQSITDFECIGIINPDTKIPSDHYIGNIDQLTEIVQINRINELVFCATDISSQRIIREMLRLESAQVHYKIAPPQSLSIIGSNSIDTAGDLYTVDFNNITKEKNLRNKRLFDIIASILLLALYPLLMLFIPQRLTFLKHIFYVLLGIKSWVGFYFRKDVNTLNLPRIKKGVISWVVATKKENEPTATIEKMNLIYAKDYKITNDISAILKGWKSLGKT